MSNISTKPRTNSAVKKTSANKASVISVSEKNKSKNVKWSFPVYSSYDQASDSIVNSTDCLDDPIIVSTKFADIKRSDLSRLDTEQKFNSTIVNFYINFICLSSPNQCINISIFSVKQNSNC